MEVRVLSPALLCLVALLGAGCTGSEEEGNPPPPTAIATWEGAPRPGRGGRLDVAGFNRFLAGRPGLAQSPLRAGIEFARLDRVQAATTSAVASTAPEGGNRAVVVLTASGLLDDSVRATRYTLAFERRGETWRLRSGRQTQRCWPRRGHQGFSPRRCL